jgi:hypothetical protein
MTVHNVHSRPEWCQPLARYLQHLCITVNTDQPSARRSGAKKCFRVPPLAQGGVDIYRVGLWAQRQHDFPHQHGNVFIVLVEVHRQTEMVVL